MKNIKYTGMTVRKENRTFLQCYVDNQLRYDDLAGNFLTAVELHARAQQ